MTMLHLIVLGIIQGITEFLPVSSSAHLILVPKFLGEADQGLLIDLGAHFGTLFAVLLLFRAEVARMVRGGFDLLQRRVTDDAKLLLLLALGTIPAGIAGILMEDIVQTTLRHVEVIIFTGIFWGAMLWIADRVGKNDKTLETGLTWKNVLIVGFAQALALVPGTSRSGITMTAARFLGFPRVEAARFSFLLSIPITAAAAGLGIVKLIQAPADHKNYGDFFAVAGISFVTALLAVVFLLRWLKRFSFTPFVIYRFILAGVLIMWFV
jgi:undecaprenyl-diphosphatase